MVWLGFDPGKDKCGAAVVDATGRALHWEVVPSAQVLERLPQLVADWQVQQIVMGDRTMARSWQQQLAGLGLPIALTDEHNSSLEARGLYWEMYPPQGLQRLVPEGMRLPPRPIDDLVAIILVRRYLNLGVALDP
jgi:RNase H-fold protein (predicted Holliday junction resolvase)